MIGLVMAGGRGFRMAMSGGPAEKLLVGRGDGMPVVLGVVDALRSSGAVSVVHAATSASAPAAAAALRRAGVGIVPTEAAGYSLDLAAALSILAGRGHRGRVLVVPGDMPLLRAGDVRAVARAYSERAERDGRRAAWAAFVVPVRGDGDGAAAAAAAGRFEYLAPGGKEAYTGVSIVDLADGALRPGVDTIEEIRIALDLRALRTSYNTAADIGPAARRAGGMRC